MMSPRRDSLPSQAGDNNRSLFRSETPERYDDDDDIIHAAFAMAESPPHEEVHRIVSNGDTLRGKTPKWSLVQCWRTSAKAGKRDVDFSVCTLLLVR